MCHWPNVTFVSDYLYSAAYAIPFPSAKDDEMDLSKTFRYA